MRRAIAFVLLVLVAASSMAQDGPSIFVRLESPELAVRDAAEAEWDALDAATQIRLAREALTDPAAPGAIAAARRVSPWSLDLDEIALDWLDAHETGVAFSRIANAYLPR